MDRDVDDVIGYIKSLSYIPPVMKQVMINRLEPFPTQEEVDQAAALVHSKVLVVNPGNVISYKGENYYRACGVLITDMPGGGSSFCVKRANHQGNIHEDYNGTKKDLSCLR